MVSPKLIMVAGPNGSGKTTITEKRLRHQWMNGCTYVNPDDIAQKSFGDWNDPVAMANAANFALTQRNACLNARQDLSFETVFSGAD
jgi:predicted ABC-type ATPase